MLRVKKVNGWNRYRIQKRFMLIWFNLDEKVYTSQDLALLALATLICEE